MAKYFEVDFRKGSFADQTGRRAVTVTGSPMITKMDKGLAASLISATNLLTYPLQILPDNSFTIVVYYKRRTGLFGVTQTYGGEGILKDDSAAYPALYISDAAYGRFSLQLGLNNYRTWATTYDPSWHCAIITCPGSAQTDINNTILYLDGVVITVASTLATNVQSSRSSVIKLNGYAGSPKIDVSYLATYDHVFTEQERAAAYKDFLNSQPISKEKYPNVVNKPTDLSREKDNTLTRVSDSNPLNFSDAWGKITDGTGEVLSNNSFRGITGTSIGYNKGILTLNKKYRVRITGTFTGGNTFRCGNVFWTELYTPAQGGGIINIDTTFIPTVSNTFMFYMFGGVGTVTIDSFILEEVTGLVAAYNMIPNGNTLVDISGNGKNGTALNNPTITKQGVSFSSSKRNYYGSIPSTNIGTVHTINTRFRCKTNSTGDDNITVSSFATQCTIDLALGAIYYMTNGALVSVSFTKDTLWHTLSIVRNNLSVSFYIDGVQLGATQTLASNTDYTFNSIGSSTSTYNNSEVADIRVYNRALTLSEIKAYHNSFVQPTLIVDFSDEGADGVAKVPSGWSKVSGSFKIGEVSGLNKNLPLTGYVLSRSTETVNSDGSKTYNITIQAADVQGFWKTFWTLGKTYRVKFKAKTVGLVGSSFWYCGDNFNTTPYVTVVKNSTLSTEYQEYEYIIKPSTTEIYIGVINKAIGADFTIKDFYVEEISGLSTIVNGTKYLECVTAGVINIPSKQAYGVWEFDLCAANTYYPWINFINSNKNPSDSGSYNFYIDSNGKCWLNRTNEATVMATANGYVALSTWYSFRITRTSSGVFTILVKGGAFTPTTGYNGWTLLSTSGGSGTNPATDNNYTSSEYFTLNFYAGDRITNIALYDGKKTYPDVLGAELVDQNSWYTLAYWGYKDPNFTQSGSYLHSNGNSGAATKAILTVGKKYQVTCTVNRVSGSLFIYDAVLANYTISTSGTHSFVLTPQATSLCIESSSFNGDLTSLSVKELIE